MSLTNSTRVFGKMRFDDYLSIAIRAADDVFNHKFSHGCVIYKGDTLISIGHNKKIYSPHLFKYGYTEASYHAETDAIFKAKNIEDLRGASLIVIRRGKNKLCSSKPCKHCMGLIAASGIDKVFYSNRNGDIEWMKV